MYFASWLSILSLASLVVGIGGCTVAYDPSTNDPPVNTDVDGAKIRFVNDGTLALGAGQLVTIAVRTDPAARYPIGFALVGASLNASLSQATAKADDDGYSEIVLRAPDSATTFRVRATIKDGASAELAVSVSEQGFGKVRIVPTYSGGRVVSEWAASVVARTTCSDLSALLTTPVGMFPEDPPGGLTASAASGSSPLIDDAPVGPSLAVAVRVGHAMWGCTDRKLTTAGATVDVQVDVRDVPMRLDDAELDVGLQFSPDPGSFTSLMSRSAGVVGEAFLPKSVSLGAAVLDTMQSKAVDGAAFSAARVADDWTRTLNLALIDREALMRQGLARWLAAAESPTMGVPGDALPMLEGRLATLEPEAPSSPASSVAWVPTSFAGFSAADAGIIVDEPLLWSAQPGDVLGLSGMLRWSPSRLVGVLAERAATHETAAETMGDVLVSLVDCGLVGQVLGGYDSCDAGCVVELCDAAVRERWRSATSLSEASASLGSLDVTLSGIATVDDAAVVTGLLGAWIGTMSAGGTSCSVQGAAGSIESAGDSQPSGASPPGAGE